MADTYTYLTDLPDGVNEMVCPCLDGFTIYINARLDHEHQQKAYRHALRHIERNDFEKEDVEMIETENHKEDTR